MSVSIPITENMMSSIAEQQTSATAVEVRKGLPVIGGTVDNQVMPIATGTSTILDTIEGIAQDDANDGATTRVAVAGQICIARVKGTVTRGDSLICKTGSTTDAENGSLEAQATIVNGDLIVAKALEDGTDQSYIKVVVQLYRVTAA
ncbi:MAG: hypothetical protein HOI47_02320 [Candidatus Scalindua sp.]|nr:hypothetical protein [Candidatus Scalindua sp.]